MPTPTDIARAAAGAFIGTHWGCYLQHDEHGEALATCILLAAKEIEAVKARRRGQKDTEADSTFEAFWSMYDKKTGRKACQAKWRRLSAKARKLIMEHLPHYVEMTPDVEFRKNPLTYLNGAYWLDDVAKSGAATALLTHAEAVKVLDDYGSNKRFGDLFLVVREAKGGPVMFQRKT